MLQVVMAYTVGIAACLAAFYFTPASWTVVQWTTVFFIGFFLYGPQMLIGLCGAELVCASGQSKNHSSLTILHKKVPARCDTLFCGN